MVGESDFPGTGKIRNSGTVATGDTVYLCRTCINQNEKNIEKIRIKTTGLTG